MNIIGFCKEHDIPYIEREWKYMEGLGKSMEAYLSKMHFCTFKEYRFKDSDRLNAAYKRLFAKKENL